MPIEIYSTQQIDTYLLNPTKRCQETPEFVHFKDEIYTFQNYNYDGILYNCIYGKDRRIKERCRSQILVPYTIHSKPKWEGDVIVKNSIHCNHPEIQPAKAPYFTERQIVEQIEKYIYQALLDMEDINHLIFFYNISKKTLHLMYL